jgi:hypothetical protein
VLSVVVGKKILFKEILVYGYHTNEIMLLVIIGQNRYDITISLLYITFHSANLHHQFEKFD